MGLFKPDFRKLVARRDLEGLRQLIHWSGTNIQRIGDAYEALVQIGTRAAYDVIVACMLEDSPAWSMEGMRALGSATGSEAARCLGRLVQAKYSSLYSHAAMGRLLELDPGLLAGSLVAPMRDALVGSKSYLPELVFYGELALAKCDHPALRAEVEKAKPQTDRLVKQQLEKKEQGVQVRMEARAREMAAMAQGRPATPGSKPALRCSICGKSSDELMEAYALVHPGELIRERTWLGTCPTCNQCFCIFCADQVPDAMYHEPLPACPEHKLHLWFEDD
jgi:hypothetical protein